MAETASQELKRPRRRVRRQAGVPKSRQASAASPEETQALKKKAFLTTLRDTFNIARSCDAAGISRATAYRWRDEDAAFAQAWDAAIEGCLDDIESAFRVRATRTEGKADTLAGIFLLNGYRKARFSQRHEVTGADGAPLQVILTTAPAGEGADPADPAAGALYGASEEAGS